LQKGSCPINVEIEKNELLPIDKDVGTYENSRKERWFRHKNLTHQS